MVHFPKRAAAVLVSLALSATSLMSSVAAMEWWGQTESSVQTSAAAVSAQTTRQTLFRQDFDRDASPFKSWGYVKPSISNGVLSICGGYGGYEYVFTAEPNTTYEFTASAKSSCSEFRIGIKNSHEYYESYYASSSYSTKTVRYTTGSTSTTLIAYLYNVNTSSNSQVDWVQLDKISNSPCPTVKPTVAPTSAPCPEKVVIFDQKFDYDYLPFVYWGYPSKSISGGYLSMAGDNGGFEYKFKGEPNTTYEFSVSAMCTSGEFSIGIKNSYEVSATFYPSTGFTTKSVKYTTDANGTTLVAYLYMPWGKKSCVKVDWAKLTKCVNPTPTANPTCPPTPTPTQTYCPTAIPTTPVPTTPVPTTQTPVTQRPTCAPVTPHPGTDLRVEIPCYYIVCPYTTARTVWITCNYPDAVLTVDSDNPNIVAQLKIQPDGSPTIFVYPRIGAVVGETANVNVYAQKDGMVAQLPQPLVVQITE